MRFAEEIKAAHPTKTGRHDLYALASELVGERYTKAEFIALVNFLLFSESRSIEECLKARLSSERTP